MKRSMSMLAVAVLATLVGSGCAWLTQGNKHDGGADAGPAVGAFTFENHSG